MGFYHFPKLEQHVTWVFQVLQNGRHHKGIHHFKATIPWGLVNIKLLKCDRDACSRLPLFNSRPPFRAAVNQNDPFNLGERKSKSSPWPQPTSITTPERC